MSTPLLFDRKALALHKARAVRSIHRHDFLLREMAVRLAERLQDLAAHATTALLMGAPAEMLGNVPCDYVVQTHLAPSMLAALTGACVAADEERLPFAPEAFDAILSCGTLHWVNDVPGALIQIRHALKPGGLFLAIFPGGETLHELRQALTLAEQAETGGVHPRVSPFADAREVAALLQRTGFHEPVVDSERITVEYADLPALTRDLRGMGEANVLAERARGFTRKNLFSAAQAVYSAEFGTAEGRIPATFQFIGIAAWKS